MERRTRQRSALEEMLQRTSAFQSAQQLHANLLAAGETRTWSRRDSSQADGPPNQKNRQAGAYPVKDPHPRS
jgi:hypothetical protein